MIRLYNTHPTQAFVRIYNSQEYIFQPQRGEWAMKRTTTPQGRKMNKPRVESTLEKISDRKVRNWIEVPDDLAHTVLTGDMRGLSPDGEISPYFHGGFIKEMKDLETELESEISDKEKAIASKEERMRAIDEELARKQKMLDELELTKSHESKRK